jgi:hypothetical protein
MPAKTEFKSGFWIMAGVLVAVLVFGVVSGLIGKVAD